MLDPVLEAQLLRQAVDAGLLSEQDLRDLDVGRAAAGPADASEFGVRIDHLVQIGKLRKEDMAALLASMRAAATAKTMDAEQDLALVQTLDGAPVAPREPQVSIRFPVANWARYELLGLLGEGGMGAVYKAVDRKLGRTVALKFIRSAVPHLVMRFLQEARAQARIDHPGICKVYEAGEVEGKAFIAMQFVDGKPLDRAAASLSLNEKVLILRDVAEAMHSAHRLGIIHRDLKPSNIMIEPRDDGGWHPVVMDFGLAREGNDNQGLTETGAVMGTPAYMSPEQARGEVRSLDRRTDIYSLGATLYDVLAGVPPFEAESVVDILLQVLDRDPMPLRRYLPSIPVDLETIVLKSMNKDPSQRYESAKAFADDLNRYLAGEPIQGRREGLVSRARRLARRNRLLVAVSLVSLVLLIGLGAFGIRFAVLARRERVRAADRARLIQQLSQDMKDLEWLMRSAYQLPLHDITPEQALIRERMAKVAAMEQSLPAESLGLLHYALGRGHLTLHEIEPAYRELTRARAQGVDIGELHYALGIVQGELYRKALQAARRGGDKAWLESKQRELEKLYLEPAVTSLERSRGAQLASATLLESLIAFYRKDYAQAVAQAKRTAAATPWLYEARKIEGDVYLEQASEQRAHGDSGHAMQNLGRAIALYDSAAEIGRSDASIQDAIAEARILRSEIDRDQGRYPVEALEQALKACSAAVQAAPTEGAGYSQQARVYFWLAWDQLVQGQDPRPTVKKLIAAAEKAVAINPQDAFALDALGNGWAIVGNYERDIGLEPSASWDQAARQFDRAMSADRNFPWARNDLGLIFYEKARYLAAKGNDPSEEIKKAVLHFGAATQIYSEYASAYNNIVDAESVLVSYDASHGRRPNIEAAKAAADAALRINKTLCNVDVAMGAIYLAQAQYVLENGDDPSAALALVAGHLERAGACNPRDSNVRIRHGRMLQIAAAYSVRKRQDPTTFLEAGLSDALQLVQEESTRLEGLMLDVALKLIAITWRSTQQGSVMQQLHAAYDAARRALALAPSETEALLNLARVRLRWAEATRLSETELREGLAAAEQALKQNADLAHGHALRGALLLLQAEQARSAENQRVLLEAAQASFDRMQRSNPLLRAEYRSYLEKAAAQPGPRKESPSGASPTGPAASPPTASHWR